MSSTLAIFHGVQVIYRPAGNVITSIIELHLVKAKLYVGLMGTLRRLWKEIRQASVNPPMAGI